MLIPPKYTLTPKISQLLASIEASKAVINSITIPPEIEINIRRASSLKSSLFSARIEGNTLTLEEATRKSSKDQQKVEVFNILKALNLLQAKKSHTLIEKDLFAFHSLVMHGLIDTSQLGKFRREVSAIFNTAGIAIYMPPPPRQIPLLVERLLKYSNGIKEQFIPIKAVLTHYMFEKIHPFLDGNGRVGRLLLQSVLHNNGYGMKGLLAIEEYLDQHRPSYYRSLEEPEKDVTDYLTFMLEAIAVTADKAQQQILEKQNSETNPEDLLLPRRLEILYIIRDHKSVSFDRIRRRFLAVNERALRYDLKKLTDQGFIRKRGTTKGVFYQPKE